MSKNRIPLLIGTGLLTAAIATGLMTTDHTAYAAGSAYKTMDLSYSDLIITATSKLSTVYPELVYINYNANYSTTHFVSYLVINGTYVEEGDPLIEISCSIDEIDLLQVQMEYDRAVINQENYLAEAANNLKAAKSQVTEATNATARRIAELQLEKLEMEQEKTKTAYENQVNSLAAKIEAYQNEAQTTTINAPASGLVHFSTRNTLHTGDRINSYTYIGYINETDTSMFHVENPSRMYRYGQKVTLIDRDNHTYAAHVGNCQNDILSGALISEYAYIIPDEEIPVEYYLNLSVSFESIHMEHVLMVPTSAYHTDSNGSYVYVVCENGALMKQYFTRGRSMSDFCVVVDGLTEGMTIVTN